MSALGEFEQLIKKTVDCLEQAAIDYCIVGAIAASYYGSVRSTEDLDVIIDLSPREKEAIKELVACAGSQGIDLLENELIEGLLEKGHITAFDKKTYFYRVDFKGVYSSFDRETMNKKQQVRLFEKLEVWLTAPEVQIVAKLLPGMRTEKDLLDVKNILLNFQENLNWEYLRDIAKRNNVEKFLEELTDK